MSYTGRRVSVSDEGSKTSEKYHLAFRGAGGGERGWTNPNEKIQVNAKRKKPEKPEKRVPISVQRRVNSVLNLPDERVTFFKVGGGGGNSNNKRISFNPVHQKLFLG